MGTQNLNNHYFKKVDAKISYDSYYDLFLVSDEKDYNAQVVYSTNIIDHEDGDKLPVWIDLNSPYSSDQLVTDCVHQYNTANTSNYYTAPGYRPFVVLSKNQWSKAKSQCDCPVGTVPSGVTICDGFWTNIDNGLNNIEDVSTDCITLYDIIPTNPFNIFSYDKRFKMHQVKAFGHPTINTNTFYTDTTILNKQDNSGYYQKLCGGFYQGFYKLYGYPYEVLPTRPNKGWSFETYLKLETIGNNPYGPITNSGQTGGVYGNCYNTSGFNLFGPYQQGTGFYKGTSSCCSPVIGNWPQHQLNYSSRDQLGFTVGRTDKYGFFFYKGIRAEDKYFYKTTQLSISGCTTISGQTNCCGENDPEVNLVGENKSPTAEYDVYSNALGFRITDDMRIGYRAIRYTGSCITTGQTCDSGQTQTCGYTIEENYSNQLCEFITKSGSCTDTWIQVDVVFNRNRHLEDCEIHNNGGVNDLINVDHENKDPKKVTTKTCDEEYPKFVKDTYFDFNCTGSKVTSWFDERDYRLGTLTFYINGRRFHTVHDFEEIIPRQLNTNKQTQVGVAYNMSWGGGALGLRESLHPTDCDIVNPTLTNLYPEPDQRLIMKNFAGSFIGGISQMMYYIKPLTPDEIYHNFKINKTRYDLVDCEESSNCPNCPENVIPGQPIIQPPDVYGCMDSSASNYNSNANISDGSCYFLPPQITYIPDAAFRSQLALAPYNVMFDISGGTETTNISSINSLSIANTGIQDLTGIEDFEALTLLYVGGNSLTSLDVSSCTLLTHLECQNNNIDSIDLTQNTALTHLNVKSNALTSLDVSQNTVLLELRVMNNLGLTSLDVSQNPNLQLLYTLNCIGLISLDVSQCPNLTSLWTQQCTNMESLNVNNGNNISFISFQAYSNPNLSCITVDNVGWSNSNWTAGNGNVDPGITFSSGCP